MSRNTNALIKGLNSTAITKNLNEDEHFYPVIFFKSHEYIIK